MMKSATLSLLLAVPTPLAQTQNANLELHERSIDIRSGGAYQANVGRLSVRENRLDPESRTIKLAFVRLRSTAAEPGPPTFYLPGGPGNEAVPFAPSPAWIRFLELGDVVLLDPRAVGESEPNLAFRSSEIRPELFFTDRETAVGHMAEQCELAAVELARQGADLRGYTPVQMADDVAELAAALGYERIRLMGHSYGTHLALAILSRNPDLVERFVSIGTAGPNDMMKLPGALDASLERLAEIVAADPLVGEAMPDLVGTLRRVVEGLREEPLEIELSDPRTGATRSARLGPFGLQLLLVADLGDTNDLPVYPRLLHSLERRDPSVVSWFLAKRLNQFSRVPVLMLTMRGAAGATPARWKRIRREARDSPFGLARCMFSPESDQALAVHDVGNDYRKAVESDVPVLFISGTLDAHTPPEQAEAVRAGFPNSGHVIVEYAGHEDLMPDPEVQEHILAFLAGDQPEDALLLRDPPRFAPLEGSTAGFDHPALSN